MSSGERLLPKSVHRLTDDVGKAPKKASVLGYSPRTSHPRRDTSTRTHSLRGAIRSLVAPEVVSDVPEIPSTASGGQSGGTGKLAPQPNVGLEQAIREEPSRHPQLVRCGEQATDNDGQCVDEAMLHVRFL